MRPEDIEARVIRHAQAAWLRLRADPSLLDWQAVGLGLKLGRASAMRQARAGTPRGKAYNLAFGRWLKLHGLDAIDAADRSALFHISEHRSAITAWLDTLPLEHQNRINHPAVLWRKYKAAGPPPVAVMLDADAAANGQRIASRMRQLGLSLRQQVGLVRKSCQAAVAELRSAAGAVASLLLINPFV